MKISLSGLRYAEFMRIDLPSQIEAEGLTRVLAIDGVECYYMHENALWVQYDVTADASNIAAHALLVIANSLGVALDECVIEVNDKFYIDDDDACTMADDIAQRAHDAIMPAPIPSDRIDPKGYLPSYRLKS